MKHLSVGTLTEIIKKGTTSYRLNLFNGSVVGEFTNQADALEVIATHAERVLLEEKLLTEIYVKIIHNDGRKHYLCFDRIERQGVEAEDINVFEETEYEYIATHPAFRDEHEARRVINERRYTFDDLLRSAVNWSPKFTIIFGILLGLIILSGTSCLIAFFAGVQEGVFTKDHSELVVYLGIGFALLAAWLIPFLHFVAFHINKKRLRVAGVDYSGLNWKRWYAFRMTSLFINFVIYSVSFYFVVNVLLHVDKSQGKDEMLIWYNFLGLSILMGLSLACITYMLIISGIFKLIKNVRRYMIERDDRLFFWKWYFNGTDQNIIKTEYDFFMLDPEISGVVARKDIEKTTEVKLKHTAAEWSELRKKALQSHKTGVARYVEILKGNK